MSGTLLSAVFSLNNAVNEIKGSKIVFIRISKVSRVSAKKETK
jgi:hypothetical protein